MGKPEPDIDSLLKLYDGVCSKVKSSWDQLSVDEMEAMNSDLDEYNTEIKKDTKGEKTAEEIFSGLIGNVSKYIQEIPSEEAIADLNDHERLFMAMMAFDLEVNNGGIDQYFFNSSGDYYLYALQGFERIGANRFAGQLKELVTLQFGEKYPTERYVRQEKMDTIEGKYDSQCEKVNKAFLQKEDEILIQITKWVENNSNAFLTKSE